MSELAWYAVLVAVLSSPLVYVGVQRYRKVQALNQHFERMRKKYHRP